MKKFKLISTTCLIVIATITCQAQTKTVIGTGNIKTEERNLAPFNSIIVNSGIEVELKQGENQSVVVQTHENLVEYITTKVEGGVLNIYPEVNIGSNSDKYLKLLITMKDIKSIQASSAVDIAGLTVIKADKLDINISSAANIDIDVTANELNITISSAGNAILKGNVDKLNVAVSSSGELNAYQLKTREAKVTASSAGDAEIYVTEKLSANTSSASSVYYLGDPKSVDSHSSGSGKIVKR
jgi:hypothetical protein